MHMVATLGNVFKMPAQGLWTLRIMRVLWGNEITLATHLDLLCLLAMPTSLSAFDAGLQKAKLKEGRVPLPIVKWLSVDSH